MSYSIQHNSFAVLLGIALTASVFTGCDVKANLKVGSFNKKTDDAEAEQKALAEVERNSGLAAFKRKDFKTAVAHFTAAAEKGDAEAQYMLAMCCGEGKGMEQDTAKSLEWALQSAEQGFSKAQFVAGMCYMGGGEGIPKDTEKGETWVRKSLDGLREAAENGDVEALSYLGLCYLEGIGVEKDKEQALELLRKAGELGSGEAQFAIGVLCMQEKKLDEAVDWFRKAAGNDSYEAMLFLGRIYENGMKNVKPNKAEAEKWYKKAAAATDSTTVNEAKSSLNRLRKKK